MKSNAGPPAAAFGLVLGIFVVLMSATWFRHTDVGDAQLYQVIARQMPRFAGAAWPNPGGALASSPEPESAPRAG